MFREKKVFRLEKKKVRNDLNKKPISQAIGRNIVISVIFQKLNKHQISFQVHTPTNPRHVLRRTACSFPCRIDEPLVDWRYDDL